MVFDIRQRLLLSELLVKSYVVNYTYIGPLFRKRSDIIVHREKINNHLFDISRYGQGICSEIEYL